MDLETRLSVIEKELVVIKRDVHLFSADSKFIASLDEKRLEAVFAATLVNLGTVAHEIVDDKPLSPTLPGSFPMSHTGQRPVALSKQLQDLDEASSTGFEHICGFYRSIQDINARQERIESDLNSISTDTSQSLERLNKEIAAKQQEEERIEQLLVSTSTEEENVSEVKERNREHRNVLRFGRVVAWGAAAAFPIALPIAAGMEIGAQ